MQINLVTLSGRLGRTPDVKYFESGTFVTKFSLAVDKNTSKKDEPPYWIDCECWGKTGEVVATYCDKGSQIGASGSFYAESWEDKTTGATRTKHVLKIDSVTLLGGKKDGDNGGGNGQQTTPSSNDFSDIDF